MPTGRIEREIEGGRREDGSPGPLPNPIGRLLSLGYGLEIARRNGRYDRGAGVRRLDRPVISVGNLSVGGTGKTPLVAMVVETLVKAGRRPCVAMRGYRSEGGESDEASEYRRRFSGIGVPVPIVAQADRIGGLQALFAGEQEGGREVDCVVLDDGFQHRRLARDLDIVVLDATRDPFEDRLLPRGWLREPVGSLERADVLVVSHAEAAPEERVDSMLERCWRANPRAARVVSRHVWTGFADARGRSLSPEALGGRAVLAVCAIGNPGPFLEELERRAGRVVEAIRLRDHDPYDGKTVKRVAAAAREKRAEAIVCTEKDWSKLSRASSESWPCPVVRPKLVLELDRGREELARRVLEAAPRSDVD